MEIKRRKTRKVRVGDTFIGGDYPILIQSMANTDTADVGSTAAQCIELAQAGSEMVRITVNVPEAARAVPEIKSSVWPPSSSRRPREKAEP